MPLLGADVEYSDVEPILDNLHHVELCGMCDGFSVGLTASGTAVP